MLESDVDITQKCSSIVRVCINSLLRYYSLLNIPIFIQQNIVDNL
jgi:hypothetical protein